MLLSDFRVLEQGTHPLLASHLTNIEGRITFERHVPNLRGHGHHFVDAHASTIALLITVGASLSFHEVRLLGEFRPDAEASENMGWRLVANLAFGANFSHQSLSQDRKHGASHQERLDANIDQTCNSTGRIVRV